MEPQKYYDFNNGVYCVHFPNRRGLSVDEITNIFSEFGNVVNVVQCGDDFGHRFVKYRNEDEVIRCVEGLRNNQSIRLKIKDPNFKKNKNQNYNNNQPGIPYGQKNYEHNGQRTEFNDNNNRRGFTTPGAEGNSENKEQYVNNNSNILQAETKKFSAIEQRINEARRGTKNAYDHEMIAQKPYGVQDIYSEPSKLATPLRPLKVASEGFTSVQAKTCTDIVTSSSKTSHGIPYEIVHNPINEAENSGAAGPLIQFQGAVPRVKPDYATENLPRLIMKNSDNNGAGNNRGARSFQTSDVLAPKTETAEQVVVANIHTDFGVNYILHLFRKHDPLSVSEMKIVSSLGLRFCIVYLQSLHQAYAIEKEFDKFNLSGKNLIVLRPERLVELSV